MDVIGHEAVGEYRAQRIRFDQRQRIQEARMVFVIEKDDVAVHPTKHDVVDPRLGQLACVARHGVVERAAADYAAR